MVAENKELDTRNLKLNIKYKNYKIMCEILNEKRKSGKSKMLQLENWKRFFNWKQDGNGYIITEIYKRPKEKIDNRKGHSGKSLGSRSNYKGIYSKYIDMLVLQYLQKEKLKLKDTCKIYTTNNKIAENTGIVNCNYRTALESPEKFYNTVKNQFDIKTNTYCMKDTFYNIKTKIRDIVKSSLDRLKKRQKLEYEVCYFIYISHTIRIPNKVELEIINKSENETMEEMGIEHKNKIDNSEKLTKDFNRKVLEKVQKELDYVKSIFKGYSITLCENFEIKSNEDIESSMKELSALVVKSLKEKPQQMQKKTRKDENLELWFGARSPFWTKWVFDRLSKKYIEYCYNFIDILCSYEADNIVNKIKSCKDRKIPNSLTSEQKENQKDKILMELIEKVEENVEVSI